MTASLTETVTKAVASVIKAGATDTVTGATYTTAGATDTTTPGTVTKAGATDTKAVTLSGRTPKKTWTVTHQDYMLASMQSHVMQSLIGYESNH